MFQVLFLAVITLFAPHDAETQAEASVFMCKCEIVFNDNPADSMKRKEVYIFMVEGELRNGCCDNPVLEKYPGFIENWESDSPKYPKVFSMQSGSAKGLPAAEAQDKGCAYEDKLMMVVDARKSPDLIWKYYPDFSEDN